MLVGESLNDQMIDLAVGETVEVRLPENPSTGFRWHVIADGKPACALVGDAFAAPSGPPGRGGEHSWTFGAVHPGQCDIELRYRRRWEGAGDTGRSFKVHVRVGSRGQGTAPRP
ncbi:MAG TPA: protease inhibitor I42 family protein [Stellaceae bacterium]